jgi:hypothetical protein
MAYHSEVPENVYRFIAMEINNDIPELMGRNAYIA